MLTKRIATAVCIVILAAFQVNAMVNDDLRQDSEESIINIAVLTGVDLQLQEARTAMVEGRVDEAILGFEALIESDDLNIKWGAYSGLSSMYRQMGEYALAHEVIELARVDERKAAGLMDVWDGDVFVQEGDYDAAIKAYMHAHEVYGDEVVNDIAMGPLALHQASSAAVLFERAEDAVSFTSQSVFDYPNDARAEETLAQMLVYEVVKSGDLPLRDMDSLIFDRVCLNAKPCVIAGGRLAEIEEDLPNLIELAGYKAYKFVLSVQDREVLESIRSAGEESPLALGWLLPTAFAADSYETCSEEANPAKDGFGDPMTYSSVGDIFMTYPAAAGITYVDTDGDDIVDTATDYTDWYHPGIDYNEPSDCGDSIYAAAAGCVQWADVSSWGSLAITHNYIPYNGKSFDEDYVTSVYGHASAYDTANVSTGNSVTLGQDIGTVGKVGAASCHLHFEIREPDHPDPYKASYWNTDSDLSMEDIGLYYSDPETYIDAHPGFDWAMWIDESSSRWTYSGSWTYQDEKGNGNDEDENDLNWAYSLVPPYATADATLAFTAMNTGSHNFYMFAPWSTAKKTDAIPVDIVDSTGTSVLSTTVDFYDGSASIGTCDDDQENSSSTDSYPYLDGSYAFTDNKRCDEWITIGSASLTEGEDYELTVDNYSTSAALGEIIIIDDIYITYGDGTGTGGAGTAARLSSSDAGGEGEVTTVCEAPAAGDWSVEDDCYLEDTQTALGNVEIEDGVTMTIGESGVLDMDLSSYYLKIKDQSRVIIEEGGKID